jgi:16S rRNA processing protein RimM
MLSQQFVSLGWVVKTHGLKGEVSVAPATDLPFVLPAGLVVWFVPPTMSVRHAGLESVRMGPKGPLLKFKGVDDVTTAATLRGAHMLSRAADLPKGWSEPSPSDATEAVGLTVSDEEHGTLGVVIDVIETGANDVWVIGGPFGQVLLPVIDEVVLIVDEDARTATVRLLPGLLAEDSRP